MWTSSKKDPRHLRYRPHLYLAVRFPLELCAALAVGHSNITARETCCACLLHSHYPPSDSENVTDKHNRSRLKITSEKSECPGSTRSRSIARWTCSTGHTLPQARSKGRFRPSRFLMPGADANDVVHHSSNYDVDDVKRFSSKFHDNDGHSLATVQVVEEHGESRLIP